AVRARHGPRVSPAPARPRARPQGRTRGLVIRSDARSAHAGGSDCPRAERLRGSRPIEGELLRSEGTAPPRRARGPRHLAPRIVRTSLLRARIRPAPARRRLSAFAGRAEPRRDALGGGRPFVSRGAASLVASRSLLEPAAAPVVFVRHRASALE